MAKTIAIYGKGGVGKTTIAANIAAALAGCGKVLLVGCNPAADSSHLLTGERVPVTLNALVKNGHQPVPEAVVTIGYQGVGCLEIGEPADNGGCSAKSIAEAVRKIHASEVMKAFSPDFIIYDMPGDIGCLGELSLGGSAVDIAFIITSADFRAMYAANRLISLLTYVPATDGLSLIVNGSSSSFEDSFAEDFARQAGIAVAAKIPKSFAVRHSELYGKTVIEAGPLSSHAQTYKNLAKLIAEEKVACTRTGIKPLGAAKLKEWAHEWGRRLGELEFGIISDGAGI
jgi:nitrogenase iron protein NifH